MKHTARPMRKLLALLLCFAMFSALLIPTASAETTTVDGVEYTLIKTPADLKAIGSNLGGKYMLANDIVLTENWAPLNAFTGVLDGNGYAIRNLNIVNAATASWATAGLFKSINGGTVKNLTLYGKLENTATQSVELGSVAGVAQAGAQIINCVNNMDLVVKNTAKNPYVGGIVADAKDGVLIRDCVNNGNISVEAPALATHVAGICGTMGQKNNTNADYIENCVNNGDVTVADGTHASSHASGILGTVTANAAITVTVSNCVNFGDITSGSSYAAGITVAQTTLPSGVSSYPHTISINNCANMGSVTARNAAECFAAGIIARPRCSAVTVTNCYNGGQISAPNRTAGYVAGIAASEGRNAYNDCYSVAQNDFTTYPSKEKFEGASFGLIGYGGYATAFTGGIIDANTDLDEVLIALQGDAIAPSFRINDGAIEPLYYLNRVNTTMVGAQFTAVLGGSYSIRFVAVVNKLYDAAGFKVAATVKAANGDVTNVPETTIGVDEIYDSLLAITNGAEEAVEAPVGTCYMALKMLELPADATVTFTVTPYTVTDGVTAAGEAMVFNCTNGGLIY